MYSNSKVAIAEKINEFTICSVVEGEELTSTEGIPHKYELLLAQPLPEDTTEAQKEQFMALFSHYSDVIAGNPEDLGRTSVLQHHINTGTSPRFTNKQGGYLYHVAILYTNYCRTWLQKESSHHPRVPGHPQLF